MPTIIPYLRIEQELPSKLTLVSANKRWLILILTLALTMPLVCLSALLVMEEEIWMFGIAGAIFGLFILILILLFATYKSQLTIDSYMRKVTSNRYYWLGFGGLERTRETSWPFNEITDVNLVSKGANKLVEIEVNGKKELLFNFGRKTEDAQRSYHLLQSWLKGLAPDSIEATTALQELASEKQTQSALKHAEKLLYYFGGFSLLAGVMGLFADNLDTSSISTITVINFVTGFIYLACGFGARHRFEGALWVAILVVLAERLYWFIMSGSLSGDGNWSSWLTWVFAIFVVSSLWQAIRSIRAMEKNPVYEPLA